MGSPGEGRLQQVVCCRAGDKTGFAGAEEEAKLCSQLIFFPGWSGLCVPRESLLIFPAELFSSLRADSNHAHFTDRKTKIQKGRSNLLSLHN